MINNNNNNNDADFHFVNLNVYLMNVKLVYN